MKTFFGLVAVLIAIGGYFPYLKDTFSGKTKPHIFSWFLWCLVSFIAFGIQITNEGGWGSLPNLVMGVICLIIFIKSLSNGTKNIKKLDIFSLVLAMIALVLWLMVKQPLYSMLIIIVVDFFSFLPTILKSWSKPQEETMITWILNCVRQIFIIFSIQEINFINVIYPIYALTAVFLFCIMLIIRKRQLSPGYGLA